VPKIPSKPKQLVPANEGPQEDDRGAWERPPTAEETNGPPEGCLNEGLNKGMKEEDADEEIERVREEQGYPSLLAKACVVQGSYELGLRSGKTTRFTFAVPHDREWVGLWIHPKPTPDYPKPHAVMVVRVAEIEWVCG
jgi:hypothetical protein